MEGLSIAMEQYLETVYELAAGGGCRVSDIAAKMKVSKASVNSAMNVLSSKGLVENEKYREVRLTAEGEKMAQLLSRRHAILLCLLADVAGVEPSLANQDACAIEHVVSPETIRQVAEFLSSKGFSISPVNPQP